MAWSMSDYFIFIIDIVSRLDPNTYESRQEAYKRACVELVAVLRKPALKIPESEIAGELRAFEIAVQKVEHSLARASGKMLAGGASAPTLPQNRSRSGASAKPSEFEANRQPLSVNSPASMPSRTLSNSKISISIARIEPESLHSDRAESERPMRDSQIDPKAGGQPPGACIPASMSSRNLSGSIGSIFSTGPSTGITSIEPKSLEFTSTKTEATGLDRIGKTESAPPMILDHSALHRQKATMLRAIGTPRALKLAAEYEQLANATGGEHISTGLSETKMAGVPNEESVALDVAMLSVAYAPFMDIMPQDIAYGMGLEAPRGGSAVWPHPVVTLMRSMRKHLMKIVPAKFGWFQNSPHFIGSPASQFLIAGGGMALRNEPLLFNEPLSNSQSRAANPLTTARPNDPLAIHHERLDQTVYKQQKDTPGSVLNNSISHEKVSASAQSPFTEVRLHDTPARLETQLKGRTSARMPPIFVVGKIMRKQLISMMRAILFFCLIFGVIYFFAHSY
jgi:hypothetical protein